VGLLHLVDEKWKSEAMLREFWVLDPPVEPPKLETEFYALPEGRKQTFFTWVCLKIGYIPNEIAIS